MNNTSGLGRALYSLTSNTELAHKIREQTVRGFHPLQIKPFKNTSDHIQGEIDFTHQEECDFFEE